MAKISKALSGYGFDLLSKEEKAHYLNLGIKATQAHELASNCDMEADLILLNKIPERLWGEQERKRYQECTSNKPFLTYEDYIKNISYYSSKNQKTLSDPAPPPTLQAVKSKDQLRVNNSARELPKLISWFLGLAGVMVLVGGVVSGFSLEFFKSVLPIFCLGLFLFFLRRYF